MRIGISAGVGKNKTIRDALQEQGLSLDYVCGGIGRCGKCAVRVISGHVPVTGADRAFFSKEALEQGCHMQVTDDIEIEVAEDLVCQTEAGIQVAGLYPQDEKTDQGVPTKAAYGIAIDLGTTTIGFSLVDLATGQVESCLSRMNSQRINRQFTFFKNIFHPLVILFFDIQQIRFFQSGDQRCTLKCYLKFDLIATQFTHDLPYFSAQVRRPFPKLVISNQ